MSARLKRKFGAEAYNELKVNFDVIIEILEKDLQSSYSNMRKEANFEHPAWTFEQAAYLGEQRTLTRVIDLLTVKEARNGRKGSGS